MIADLEGIAARAVDRAGCEEPINAIDLAEGLGFEVACSSIGEPVMLGRTIFVPTKRRISLVHWLVCHELGHPLATEAGEDGSSERVANYIGGALLVPRATLLRQLRSGWDLDALRAAHPHAPAHAIAVRVAQVRAASVAVYDQGRLRRRWGTPADHERAMVDEAMETAHAVRVDDCTGAWPIFDGDYRRVIVLAPSR